MNNEAVAPATSAGMATTTTADSPPAIRAVAAAPPTPPSTVVSSPAPVTAMPKQQVVRRAHPAFADAVRYSAYGAAVFAVIGSHAFTKLLQLTGLPVTHRYDNCLSFFGQCVKTVVYFTVILGMMYIVR